MSNVSAHLDKRTGNKVLCRTCGNALCSIGKIEAARTNEDGSPTRHLLFEPGWIVDAEGNWKMSTHALNRIRQGKLGAPRRAPVAFLGNERGHVPRTPRALPVNAMCWKCGSRNTLEEGALRVTIYPKHYFYPD